MEEREQRWERWERRRLARFAAVEPEWFLAMQCKRELPGETAISLGQAYVSGHFAHVWGRREG